MNRRHLLGAEFEHVREYSRPGSQTSSPGLGIVIRHWGMSIVGVGL
jgi:hypothetical protein